jgi:hypothetical protein
MTAPAVPSWCGQVLTAEWFGSPPEEADIDTSKATTT